MTTNFLFGVIVAICAIIVGVIITILLMKYFFNYGITKKQNEERKRNDEIQRSLRGQIFSYNQRRRELGGEPEILKGYTYSYFEGEELPKHRSLPVYVYQVDDQKAHAILRVKLGIYDLDEGNYSSYSADHGDFLSNVEFTNEEEHDWINEHLKSSSPRIELYLEGNAIKTRFLCDDDDDFTY